MKTSDIYRHICIHIQLMQSPFLLMVWGYKWQYIWQNTNIEKIYEYASELGNCLHFHILKLLFPSIFCWYFWYFISETYVFSGLKLQFAWLYHQCSSLWLLMVWHYIQTTVYRQSTDIEKIYEYASERGVSELGQFLHFCILKLLFPSIFCWYFWYFISETYIFSGLKLQSAWYIYHQCSSLLLLMVWRYYIQTTVYRQITNIEKIYEYASERAWIFFLHFHILKLLFLSIFCWYFL